MKQLFLRKLLVALVSTGVAIAPGAPGYAEYIFKKHIDHIAPTDPATNPGGGTPTDPGSASASVSSSVLEFVPGPNIGQSQVKAIRYTNTGSVALTFSSAPSLTGSSVYTLSTNCASTLAVGAYCDSSVTFTPSDTNTATSTLTFNTNAGAATVAVTGAGVGIATATLDKTSLSFTTTEVGSNSLQTVRLTNNGTANLTFSAAPAVTGDAAFSMQATICGPYITPGTSCDTNVRFAPTSTAAVTGTLTFSTNLGAITVPVSGTGQLSSGSLSTSSLTFNTTAVGATSAAQTVRLSNDGIVDLNITSGPSRTGSSKYSLTTNCGSVLHMGEYCDTSVTFSPTDTSTQTGSLTVTTNAGTFTTSLTGAGQGAVSGLVAATTNDFGSVSVGASASLNFTYTNSGNIAATGVHASSSGTGLTVSGCGTVAAPITLAAGQSCTVVATYTPSSTVALSGTVSVLATNATAASVNVSSNAMPTATLDHTSLTFNSTAVGANSLQTVRITNNGSANLTFSATPAVTGDAAFSMQATICGPYITPGTSCDTNVKFAPTSTASVTGTLTFSTNLGAITVPVSGAGLQSVGSLTGASTDFGTVASGSSGTLSFTFTNTGNTTANNVYAAVTGTNLTLTGTNTCGTSGARTTVAAGATCTFSAMYSPTQTETISGYSVSVYSDVSNGTQSLSLTGSSAIIVAATATGAYTTATVGNYKVLTFTGAGTFNVTSAPAGSTVQLLVVGGGGGGGKDGAGGGGAGGLTYNANYSVSATSYSIAVGAGGAGSSSGAGAAGTGSSFGAVSVSGGGYGNTKSGAGGTGGSGGGSGHVSNTATGGAATSGQGNNGGGATSNSIGGGGGGGAGGVGTQGTNAAPGVGGAGVTVSIPGVSTTFACGGGGGTYSATVAGGAAGCSNGGKGASNSTAAGSGVANTGSGGGGGGNVGAGYGLGGNGGSGVVIVSYRFQ